MTVNEVVAVALSQTHDCEGKVTGTTGSTLNYGPAADCTSHTVAVVAKDSRGCTANASKTVTQSVTTTVN
jgi:hypothetical protein